MWSGIYPCGSLISCMEGHSSASTAPLPFFKSPQRPFCGSRICTGKGVETGWPRGSGQVREDAHHSIQTQWAIPTREGLNCKEVRVMGSLPGARAAQMSYRCLGICYAGLCSLFHGGDLLVRWHGEAELNFHAVSFPGDFLSLSCLQWV